MTANRQTLSLLLVLILLAGFASPVSAQTPAPTAAEPLAKAVLIRQAFLATDDELGWNGSITTDTSKEGYPSYTLSAGGNLLTILDMGTEAAAAQEMANLQAENRLGHNLRIHGYQAVEIVSSDSSLQGATVHTVHLIAWQADEFYIAQIDFGGNLGRDPTETLYKYLVQYGLIGGGNGPTDVMPTPDPNAGVHLTISADGYETATKRIQHTGKNATVTISGIVYDALTNLPIPGATVQAGGDAASASVVTDREGEFSFTVGIPGSEGPAYATETHIALTPLTGLAVDVSASTDELLADGKSTARISARLTGPDGAPLVNRAVRFDLYGRDGTGRIDPQQATTDADGRVTATYTAFLPDPDVAYASARHEVTVYVEDVTSGSKGNTTLNLNQHQVAIVHTEYLPACEQCAAPARIRARVVDYWGTPVADTPVTIALETRSSALGLLSESAQMDGGQKRLALATDTDGWVTAFYHWQGGADVRDAVQPFTVTEETTNSQSQKQIHIHALDLAIRSVVAAGFSGVTGGEAFLKIYLIERNHPTLPLDRFDAEAFAGVRLIIRQFHSEGSGVIAPYDSVLHLAQDERGWFAQAGQPGLPYVVPVNDGTTWYEIRADAVDRQDNFLADAFRGNNDTIFALTTGSPDGWLHEFLANGVLTPNSYTTAIIKCAARFFAPMSKAIAVIETLNSLYNADLLDLGRKSSMLLSEKVVATYGKDAPAYLTKMKAGQIDNVVSCVEDLHRVAGQATRENSPTARCAGLALRFPQDLLSLSQVRAMEDRFVQGMLTDQPDVQGVILYGQHADAISLHDAKGRQVDASEYMSAQGDLVVLLPPAAFAYTLRLETDQPVDMTIYAANDDGSRATYHHQMALTEGAAASVLLGQESDFALVVESGDGTAETAYDPRQEKLDVTPPTLSQLRPEPDSVVDGLPALIGASYADERMGSGIDIASVQILIDGEERTADSIPGVSRFLLEVENLTPGSHTVTVHVGDRDGNFAHAAWSFTLAQPNPPTPVTKPMTSVPLVPTPTATPTATATTTPPPLPIAVVIAANLNVRSGPDTGWPVIAQVRQNERLTIVGRDSEASWWQVQLANGGTGWVYGNLVRVEGNETAVPIATAQPAPARPTNTPAPLSSALDANAARSILPTADELGLVAADLAFFVLTLPDSDGYGSLPDFRVASADGTRLADLLVFRDSDEASRFVKGVFSDYQAAGGAPVAWVSKGDEAFGRQNEMLVRVGRYLLWFLGPFRTFQIDATVQRLQSMGQTSSSRQTTPTRQPKPTAAPEPTTLTGRIVFSAFDQNRRTYDVYLVNADGSGLRRVLTDASQPSLSPDGNRLALRLWQNDARGIAITDLYGSTLQRLTTFFEDSLPSWSPDGRTIVFTSRRESDRKDRIYLVQSSGGDGWEVQRGTYPSWGADKRIVYRSTAPQITLSALNGDGANPRLLILDGDATAPAAAPNDGMLVLMSRRDGNWEIYAANGDGSGIIRLTDNPANDGLPAWSPDGRAIAFLSDRGGRWQLWAMDRDGGNQRVLIDLPGSADGVVRDEPDFVSRGWLEERISWGP